MSAHNSPDRLELNECVCVGERLSGATFMHAHIEFDYATLGICTALIFCVA